MYRQTEKGKEFKWLEGKRYYENHKDEINKSISCPCGGSYTIAYKKNHEQRKIHQTYIKSLPQ